jgi:hypothetical protein
MTKRSDATRKSPTHFEQIPLEVVKKIAEAHVSKDKKAGTDDVSIEPASRKSNRRSVPARFPDTSGR